jgi:ribosomal protein S18 acetylase RimI-like enzyme
MLSIADDVDIPALNALINDAYRGEHSKKGWTTEADLLDGLRTDEQTLGNIMHEPTSFILKYMDKGEIAACVHLRKDDGLLYLGMLTVSPELQGEGIGKKLLLAAETEARKLGYTSIYMTVLSVRKELIAWYVRHGYKDTGQRKPFDNKDPRFGIPKTPLEFVVLRKGIV